MPAPTTAPYATHTADVLAAHAEVHIANRRESFAADFMAPTVTIDRESKVIRGLTRGDLARLEMSRRASGAVADRAGYGTTTATVTVEPWALAKPTGLREIDNQDEVYDIEAADVAYLTEQWLLRREVQVSTVAWGAGIWGTDLTPATLWSAAGGNVQLDVHTAKQTIKRTGMVNAPDSWFHLFLGADTWPHVKDRLELRVNAERGMNVSEAIIARLLNVGAVHVVDAVRNTAVEAAAATGAYIFDPDDALLLCIQPQPENIGRMPARIGALFTFAWQRPGFTPDGLRVKAWTDEDADAHVTEAHAEFIHSIRNVALGYFFEEAVA